MTLSVIDAAREAPARPALIIDGAVVDYASLALGARRAARWLLDRGATPDRPVAFVAESDCPQLELLHALIALGIPALLVHPRLTPAERVRLLVREEALMLDVGPHQRVEPLDTAAFAPRLDARPLAILHTSGTSGQPKRVVLSRRAFLAAARASARNLGWQDDDRWLLCLPFAHVGGLSVVTRCLIARRTVVVAQDAAPATLAGHVTRDRVTILSVVPTLLARLLDTGWAPPAHVRAILLGGAAASPALLARAADRGWPVLTTYGLTEACSQVTTQRTGTTNRGEQGAGHPLAGVDVKIVDGAIHVRGPTLCDAVAPGAWLATGDAGFLDADGRLHVQGRQSDSIITGGENVHPLEVEAALERCPGIAAACVFGEDDAEWGQRVAAALVAGRDGPPSPEALQAHLERELASFKRPRRITWLDALPVNGSGKLDREATAAGCRA